MSTRDTNIDNCHESPDAKRSAALRRNPLASAIRAALLPAGLVLSLHAGIAVAGPEGGQVVGGEGAISRPDANTTLVVQNTQNLAIDWTSFNVAAHELVQFNQPGSTATALNRIFDQNPSQIFGQVKANGQLFLMNTNGIVFGPNSRVNVAGLVAAAAQVDVNQFMAGQYNLDASAAEGVVVNQGLIEAATGGSVTLAGKSVRNEGVILASAGKVNLVSGNRTTLDFDGDGLIQFTIDEEVLQKPAGADTAVANTGTIQADGGQVVLAARTAQDVFTKVVNNEGVIKAGRIENKGGVVKLVGLGAGASVLNTGTIDVAATGAGVNGGTVELTGSNVTQSGTIRADAANGNGGSIKLAATDTTLLTGNSQTTARAESGGKGGTVQVLGNKVGIFDQSVVDVSGAAGGGTALIGGDYQGKNPDVQNAAISGIGAGASIKADASESGNGGKIIVWADDITRFYGSASARGGAVSGDGGFVEISGKQTLTMRGAVDTRAPNGVTGTLLLDPGTLDVTDTADGTGTLDDELTPNTDGEILAAVADDGGNTVSRGQLEAFNATTNLNLEATGLITIQNMSGDLINLATGGGNSVTLRSTTSGGVVFADFNDEIRTAGGSINLKAEGTGLLTVGKLDSNGGNIVLQSASTIALNGIVDAGAGNLTLNAGGAVTQGAGDTIIAAGLELLGTGPYTLTDSGNDVDTVAANTTDAVSFRDTDDLIVGTVNTVGITTTNDNVSLQTGTTLTINDDIGIGAGNLTLNAGGAVTQGAGDTIIAAGLELLGTGPYTLTDSGNDVDTIAANTTDAVSFRDTDDLIVGTVNTVGITTTNDNVSLQTGTTLTINDVIGIGAGNLTLNAGGAVTQGAGDTITAAGLELLGAGSFTLDDAGNDVNTIAASTTEAISFTDTDGLAVGTVNTVGITTTGDQITLSVGAGTDNATLDVNNAIASGGGNINLLADNMNTLGATINAGAGTVTLAPLTSAGDTDDAVNLGGADAADVLGLTSGELNQVTAAILRIGSTASTGNLSVSAAIAPSGTTVLSLLTGGAVTQTNTITETDLAIQSVGAVTLTGANDVDNLAVNITGGTNALQFTDIDTLTVPATAIDGVTGVTTNNGTITFSVGTTVDNAALTVSGAISSGGANISLLADNMTIGAAVNAGAGTVTLAPLTSAGDTNDAVDFGGADAADVLGLTDGELDLVTAGILRVGSTSSSGNMTVTAAISPANASTLSLFTGGTLTDTSTIAVTNLAITSVGAVTLNSANNVTTLAATVTGAGNAFAFQNEADGFTVGVVDGVTGMQTADVSAAGVVTTGSITLSSTGGIVIDEAISTGNADSSDNDATSGDISITSSGGSITGDSALTTGLAEASDANFGNDPATSGSITLSASGAILLSASDALRTGDATVINGDNAANDVATSGSITISNADKVSSDGGTGAVDVRIGAVSNAGAPAGIASGTLTITTDGGAGDAGGIFITSGEALTLGALDTDNATAQNVSISVTTDDVLLTLGTAATLDTDVVTLSADKMAINSTMAAGTVTLKPRTADAIRLGSTVDTTGNTLELSDTEMDRINATTLIVGSGTAGPITVSADVLSDGGVTNLHLITSSTVTATSGSGGGINYTNLAITAVGTVDVTEASTSVTTLAISNAGNSVTFIENDGFSVGDVDGVSGVSGSTVSLTATTGNLTVTNSSAANDIDATGAVTLTVLGADNTAIVNASAHVESAAGGVTITADELTLTGTLDANAGAVVIKPNAANQPIQVGAGASDTSILGVSDTDLANITTSGGLTIGVNTNTGGITIVGAVTAANLTNVTGGVTLITDGAGDILVNAAFNSNGNALTLTAGNNAADSGDIDFGAAGALTATGTTATLSANGGRILGNASATTNITADTVNLTAETAIGTSGDVITTATQNISAQNTVATANNSQDIYIANSSATPVIINNLITRNSDTGADAIQFIQSGNGSLTVSGTVSSGVNGSISGGDITITNGGTGTLTIAGTAVIDSRQGSGGSLNNTGAQLQGGSTIHVGAGDVNLTGFNTDVIIDTDQIFATTQNYSANRDIIIRALLNVTGNVSLTADFDADGVGGVWFDGAGALGASGRAAVVATGTVSLSGSDIFAVAGTESVRIDDDGQASNQIQAGGLVTISSGSAAAANAGIIIAGNVTTSAGGVTITADNLSIINTIIATGQTVTLQPENSAVTAKLGAASADAAGILGISDNELGLITAGGVTLATTSTAGDVTIDGVTDGNSTNSGAVTVNAGGTVTFTTTSVFNKGVAVNANDGVAVNADVTATTGNIALDGDANSAADTADGISFSGVRTLTATAGSITLQNGAAGTNGNIATASALNLLAGNGVTVNDDLTVTGFDLTVNADSDDNGTGTLTVASGKTAATATAGNIVVTAANADLSGALNSVGNVQITGSTNVDVSLGSSTGGLNLTDAELGRITAASGLTIASQGAGTLKLGGLTGANTDQFGTLTLNSATTVTNEATSVVGNVLAVTGATGVAVNGGLSTSVVADGDLTLTATAGDISFATGVTVTAGGTGTLSLNAGGVLTGAGSLTLNSGDNLVLNQPLTTGGTTTINADNNSDGTGTLTVANGITLATTGAAATGAALNITAADVVLAGTGVLDSGTSGKTTITASNAGDLQVGTTATGLQLSNIELSQITSGGGLDLRTTGAGTVTANGATFVSGNGNAALLATGTGDVAFTTATTLANRDIRAQATGGKVTFDIGQVLTSSTGAIILAGGAGGADDVSAIDALGLTAANGVTINSNAQTGGTLTIDADSDVSGSGTFTVAGATTTTTTAGNIDITAADLALSGDLNSASAVLITVSNPDAAANDGSLGLGTAAGSQMTVSNAELANITAAAGTTFTTTDGGTGRGDMTVTAATLVAGMGDVTLSGGHDITFGAGSTTVAGVLSATAANAMAVNGDVTTATSKNLDLTATAGVISFGSGVTVTAGDTTAGGTAVLSLSSGGGTMTGAGGLTLRSQNGLTLNQSLTTNGATFIDADQDADGLGTFTVAATRTLGTTGGTLSITANDLALDGSINSGAARTTIIDSDGTGIGLGDTPVAGGLNIQRAELDRITAADLTVQSTGGITVDNIQTTDRDGISSGAITFGSDVTFQGTPSDFDVIGSASGDTFTFNVSHTGNVSGGNGGDTFVFTGTAILTGNLDGGAGSDTLDYSAQTLLTTTTITGVGTTDGQQGTIANLIEPVASNGFNNIDTLNGNGGAIQGPNTPNIWVISGLNAGTLNGTPFDNFSLIGGSDTDSFTITTGALTGSINGGSGGLDTLIAGNFTNTWTLTGATSGTISATGGVDLGGGIFQGNIAGGFTNIDDVTGGTGSDTFTINASVAWGGDIAGGTGADTFTFNNGATVAGTVDGGGGHDIVSWTAYATARAITLEALGTTDGFRGKEASVNGGASNGLDNIDEIQGNAGVANTLTGVDSGVAATATWTLDGTDQYAAGGRTLDFSGMRHLTGGSAADTFDLSVTRTGNLAGGDGNDTFNLVSAVAIQLTGQINGGLGSDSLSFAAYTPNVIVQLTGPGTLDEQQGSENSGTPVITGGFNNIGGVQGKAGDTLQAPDDANVWLITGVNTFTLDGSTVNFTGFTSLLGGTAQDDFFFEADGQITGGIDGGGGAGVNTVTGSNGGDIWATTGARAGTLTVPTGALVTSFARIDNVNTGFLGAAPAGTGGGGADTFNLNSSFTGTISGAAGNDVFNFTTGTTYGSLVGGGGTDTLFGGSGGLNSWSITGTNAGTLNGQSFSEMENLTGTGVTDNFTFNGGTLSGTIDGAGGTNNLFGSSGGDTVDINGAANGTILVSSVTTTFTGITNIDGLAGNDTFTIDTTFDGGILGGAGDDTFTLSDGVTVGMVTGTLAGGADTDTLIITADGTGNLWLITGSNDGSVDTDDPDNDGVSDGADTPQDFIGMENLIGNADADIFVIGAAGFLTGTADGLAGTDTLDLTAKPSPADVVLTGVGGTDGFNGFENFRVGGFANINVITGSGVGGDSLTVNYVTAATWEIDGTNRLLDTTNGRTLDLPAGYQNLTGRGGVDTFNVTIPFSGNLDGDAGNDIFNITATVFGNVAGGDGNDIYNVNNPVTGTVDVGSGDDTWNHVSGVALGSSIIGPDGSSLTVPHTAGGDLNVGTQLVLPNMTGFAGHFIVGGTITPPSSNDPTDMTINTATMTVSSPINTGGRLTLLAETIDLGSDVTSTGGLITFVASGPAGDPDQGVVSASVPVTISGQSVAFIVANTIENPGQMTIQANGGQLFLAQNTNAEQPVFQDQDVSEVSAITDATDPADGSYLQGLFSIATGETGTFTNSGNFTSVAFQQFSFSNPGAALAALEQLVFLDIGLFEQELTLFGVIGNGIAMQLSQCEEAEGCAPSVTPEQLVELIAGIDGRIAELERRKAAGEVDAATADRLIAGYQTQLAKFKQYQAELDAYLKEQQEAELEDLGEDLGGEEPSVEGEEVPVEEEAAPAEETQAEEPAAPEEAEEPAAVEEPATPAPQPAAAPEEPPAELEEQIDDTLPEEPAVQPEPPAAAPEAAPPADLPSSLEENLEEEEVLIDTSAAARLPLIQAGVSSYQWFAAPGRNRVQWVGDIVMPRAYRQY